MIRVGHKGRVGVELGLELGLELGFGLELGSEFVWGKGLELGFIHSTLSPYIIFNCIQ